MLGALGRTDELEEVGQVDAGEERSREASRAPVEAERLCDVSDRTLCSTDLLNDVLLLAAIASADERDGQRDRLEPALEVGDAELDRVRDQPVHLERPRLAGRLIDPRHGAMRTDVEERRRGQEAVVVENLELGLAVERVLRRQLGRE